jgi:hypothetical protein
VLSLNGWAVCATGIAQVRVLLDDRDAGLATFGHERTDVAAFYPDLRMAHLSGFRFEQRIGDRYQGEHSVRVVVCGAQGGESLKEISVVATEVARPPGEVSDEGEPAVSAEQAAEFRFELDAPRLSNGAMVEPVTGPDDDRRLAVDALRHR